MNTDCIFCKIGNGDIESYTVYEDDFLTAFLDANPVSRGHTLIIPKQHYENVYDIPSDLLEGADRIAHEHPWRSVRWREKLGSDGCAVCFVAIVYYSIKY